MIPSTASPKAARLLAAMLLGSAALMAALPAQACMRFTNRTTYKLFVEVHWIGLYSPRQYGPIETSARQGDYFDGGCHELWNIKTRYVVSAQLPGGVRKVVYETGGGYQAVGNRHVTIFTGPDANSNEQWFVEDRVY